MRKSLSEVTFKELEGKFFELILVTELLCEVCQKPLNERTKTLGKAKFLKMNDFQNLINKLRVYDRSEVDLGSHRIYFYNHDFPGDIHQKCLEKL